MCDCEEYDDYDYYEPSELDEIVDEAVGKFREILSDRIKEALEDVQNDLSKRAALKDEIHRVRAELARIKTEIANLEDEVALKKGNVEEEILKSFLRRAAGGFRIGDTVWGIDPEHYRKPCKYCEGKGFVNVQGGRFDCRSCGGIGSTGEYRYIAAKRTVSNVHIEIDGVRQDAGTLTVSCDRHTLRLDNETHEVIRGVVLQEEPYYRDASCVYRTEDEAKRAAQKKNDELDRKKKKQEEQKEC